MMKKFLSLFVLSVLITFSVVVPAFAAKPDRGDGGTTTKDPIGYDISYPQCGKRLPSSAAFVVVGVNGGTAASTNECLAEQLAWAKRVSTGLPNQPAIQLYVNTANPGEVINQISTWPINNTDKTGFTTNNPHGTCAYKNDLACSWQYGWNRAVEAHVDRFSPAATEAKLTSIDVKDYIWWLDVETMNTWQAGSEDALRRNVAALEGMASYYNSKGAEVGLYSTAYQWGVITGNYIESGSNLIGLRNWRPSGASLSNAKTNCTVDPLTPYGYIAMTQYVIKNLDHNYSCI